MLSFLADVAPVFPPDVRLFIIAACVALFVAAVAGFAIAVFTWWTAVQARRQHQQELAELRNQQRAIFSKLDAQATTFQTHANEVMRILGRLEGPARE
jgi:hypothetical protein